MYLQTSFYLYFAKIQESNLHPGAKYAATEETDGYEIDSS